MKLEKLIRSARSKSQRLARSPKLNHLARAQAQRAKKVAATAIERGADAFEAAAPKGPALDAGPASKTVFGGAPSFTGFDASKLGGELKRVDGVAQSAKYTFAKLAQASGTMPRTKAEAEQWFNEHIKPGLEKEGFGVDWVQGDKAMVRTRENPQGEVIDFVRGADSNDPNYTALAWQSEGPVGGHGPVPSGVTGKGAVGGSGFADRQFVMSILANYPPTNEGIQHAVAELRKKPGYEHVVVLEHPLRLDKLDFGKGHVVDVVVGSGGPNPSWGWMPE